MKERDLALIFAEHIANTGYENLSKESIEYAKNVILDTLGATVAGGPLVEGPTKIVDMVKDWGGKKESTIIGYGGKVPCVMAAYANGAMGHALDYDDTLDTGFLHTGITTVLPAFALAERLGNVSGKELITAVAIGGDVMCRLAHSVTQGPGKFTSPTWMLTCVLGVFSSATSCSKLLKLDADKTVDALGIALNQAGGTFEMAFNPHSKVMRAVYGILPGESGLKAALLASKGISASDTCLEGTAGLYKMYFAGKYDRSIALDQLGKRFDNTKISFKPWSSCRQTHTAIEIALSLVRENGIEAEQIKAVTVYINDFTKTLSEPLAERRKPPSSMFARYSIPFTVATAIVNKSVKLSNYTENGIKDERVLALAQKVTPKYDASLNKATGMAPSRIEIEMANGKTFSKATELPYGCPEKPMKPEELTDKFMDCISYAPKTSVRGKGKKIIEMVGNLENVANVADVVRLLG
jgi:2-methylcitrate dehydratase PrpD